MEFKNFLGSVTTYIETALPTILTTLKTKYPTATIVNPSEVVEGEYPDLDKYTQQVVVYVLMPEYSFEELSTESKALESTIEIYVTFSKLDSTKAKNLALIYAEAIYSIFKSDPSLDGLIDYSMISSTRFFDGVEGNPSIKAIRIESKIVKEV